MNKRFAVWGMAAGLGLVAVGQAMAAGAGAETTPGIVLSDNGNRLQDVVVVPGSDPNTIVIHFRGAERVSLAAQGAVEVINANGARWQYRPTVYQMASGKRRNVVTGFHVMDKDHILLRIRKVDESSPLVFGPAESKGLGL